MPTGSAMVDQQKIGDWTRRPLYVYDLPRDILSTLTVKSDEDDTPEGTVAAAEHISGQTRAEITPDDPDAPIGSMTCSSCQAKFSTVEDQRSHVRSDWHGYNLKQRMRHAPTVTEADFEKLVGDLDESLSGSDSESNDEEASDRKETTLSALLKRQAAISAHVDEDVPDTARRKNGNGKPPLIWLATPVLPATTYFGIYRAIFQKDEQQEGKNVVSIIQSKQLVPRPQPTAQVPLNGIAANHGPHIFLCMIGGGHFAAMIVALTPRIKTTHATGPLSKEATVLVHKTFHRYTTRRKQGGSQSANDAAKGNAHSAGSSLRRYNEQALTEDVRALLLSWKRFIDTAELLFIRATGTTNRRTLFGPYEGQVLSQNDTRLRSFPFSTRRATQNELMRSFIELTRVKIATINPTVKANATDATSHAASSQKPSLPEEPSLTEAEKTALLHTQQMTTLIRRSKLPALLNYINTNNIPTDFTFYPPAQYQHTPTPLHLASSLGATVLVEGLLLKASSDPSLLSTDGHSAYDLAANRSTRDMFRHARHVLGEDAHRWSCLGVPSALTKSEVETRAAAQKEEERAAEAERRTREEQQLREAEEEKQKEAAARGKPGSAVNADADNASKPGRRQEKGRKAALAGLGLTEKTLGTAAGTGTAEKRRREEARGLDEDGRRRLERERRARAAEARMRS